MPNPYISNPNYEATSKLQDVLLKNNKVWVTSTRGLFIVNPQAAATSANVQHFSSGSSKMPSNYLHGMANNKPANAAQRKTDIAIYDFGAIKVIETRNLNTTDIEVQTILNKRWKWADDPKVVFAANNDATYIIGYKSIIIAKDDTILKTIVDLNANSTIFGACVNNSGDLFYLATSSNSGYSDVVNLYKHNANNDVVETIITNVTIPYAVNNIYELPFMLCNTRNHYWIGGVNSMVSIEKEHKTIANYKGKLFVKGNEVYKLHQNVIEQFNGSNWDAENFNINPADVFSGEAAFNNYWVEGGKLYIVHGTNELRIYTAGAISYQLYNL